jgi:predicted PurR-regulated permease PerM
MDKKQEEINIIDPKIQNGQAPKKDEGVGPVIGSIIIIAVIVLGGLYYWGSIIQNSSNAPENVTEESLPALSESDEIIDIEQDLEATSADEIDALLDEIDSEIDDALNSL